MHPNIKLARKFSKYYPPIELPADKNDWHIGHQCLAMLEDLYPRRDLLITTLLDSYEIDKRLENIRQLRNNCFALDLANEFKDISKLYMLDSYVSFYKHRFMRTLEWLSGKMNRVHKAADKADNAIKKARHRLDFIDMIENEHVCNCGEMAHMTSLVLKANNIPFQSVYLSLRNKQGRILHDNHCFCLIRTDNKKLTFKQMIAELYHPSTLVVDWWLGRCGHPKEMFNMFANFFVEEVYYKNKRYVSYLNPGTRFLLAQHMVREGEEETNDRYVIGHTSSKTPRIFGGENQNIFSPVCVPYQETAKRFISDVVQNQHIRD